MGWKDAHCKTTHDPYTLNPSFIRALYNLDNGRLRIRWSQREQKWAIERKIGRAVSYMPNLGHYRKLKTGPNSFIWVENDSWVRARDGVICIDYVAPRPTPDHWLIKGLEYYRIERWGGAAEAARKLEIMEEEKERQKTNAQRQRWYDMAGEVRDSWMWESGQRAAVPSNYKDNYGSNDNGVP